MKIKDSALMGVAFKDRGKKGIRKKRLISKLLTPTVKQLGGYISKDERRTPPPL
jgi:hypothetical protein